MRTRRTRLQKLVYSGTFGCTLCEHRVKYLHPFIDYTLTFVFSRHTRCIRCGTPNVIRLAKRDRIDSMSKSLASLLQRLTGAPLVKCPGCRLQYYDWRAPAPQAMRRDTRAAS
jgi:hypothetical protein